MRRRGATQKREDDEMRAQLAQIESAALSSFQSKDVGNDPCRSAELTRASQGSSISSSILSSIPTQPPASTTDDDVESLIIARGREHALDSITRTLEKKSKWFESKTAEGKSFYWNRDTYETVWTAPKCGFIDLASQESQDLPPEARPKYVPFGGWREADSTAALRSSSSTSAQAHLPDLQLPSSSSSSSMSTSRGDPNRLHDIEKLPLPTTSADDAQELLSDDKPRIDFTQEKTINDTIKSTTLSKQKEVKFEFKKRKLGGDQKRNVRQRSGD